MEEQRINEFPEKDILGQDKSMDFSKSEEPKEKISKINHSNEYDLPLIKTRYFSSLIDVIFILLISLGISSLFESLGDVPDYLRLIMFIVVVILYEPILISTACTVGQLITNIRVRKLHDPVRRILIFNAILRIIVKALLGWLSFLTVTFNDNRRAIHDYLSGSIVIVPKK